MSLFFFLAAFTAEVIGTMAGFGSSTIFLPLALLFVDFKVALVLVAFLHIFGNLGRISFFRHGLDKRMLLVFGLPSVLLTFVGALSVQNTSQDILKLILGLFLIVYALLSWSGKFSIKSSASMAVLGGGLSGFFAG